MIAKIKNKIKNKSFIISIVGLGYVGLPLAFEFAKKGFSVIGIDNDQNKINKLNENKSYIERLTDENIKKLNKLKFKTASNFEEICNTDMIILCLPTPLNNNKTPNVKHIKNAIKNIKKYISPNTIISLESTTYPGTTEELICNELSNNKLKIGNNLFVVYSPEREDPGNKKFNLNNTPKVVSGYTKFCRILGKEIYQYVTPKVHLAENIKTAEMTKIFENIYRSVNISLVNEIKFICDKLNIDVFDIIEAAKTKPFGYSPFYPGPGMGGHCIPIDPFLLAWKAKRIGVQPKFIELSGEINSKVPSFIYKKIKQHLIKKNLNKEKVKLLLLGAAYKKNISDIRETPFIKISEILYKNNINFDYNDPFVKSIKIFDNSKLLKSKNLIINKINNYEIVIIVTDHDKYNYQKILKYSKNIIDTRGRYKLNNFKIIRG